MDEVVYPVACGVDVHQNSLVACLRTVRPDGRVQRESRGFDGTTPDIRQLVAWLVRERCPVVAMESTGVYWRPAYRALAAQGIEVRLANPQRVKPVRGKKTDKADAVRLAQLVALDQIAPSFIPPEEILALRHLARGRVKAVQDLTTEWNRVGKLLNDTGIKLDAVVSKLKIKSARLMLDALLAGERDPHKLADLARGILRRKLPALRKALDAPCGDLYTHLLALHLNQINVLEAGVTAHEALLEEACGTLRDPLARLCTIPGVGSHAAVDIVAEIGTDMSRFGSASRLAAWAGVCPGNNESAGKRYSGRTRSGNKHLRRILVQCAWSCRKHDSWLGHRFRQFMARKGGKKAAMAIAHKLLVIVYHVLQSGQPYEDSRYGDRYQEDAERLAWIPTDQPPPNGSGAQPRMFPWGARLSA